MSIGETKAAGGSGSTKATVALVLGILGLGFCPPTAIVAWILGKQELNAIARGESSPKGRGLALAGYVLGIIGAALMVFWIIIIYVIAIICVGVGSGLLENF